MEAILHTLFVRSKKGGDGVGFIMNIIQYYYIIFQ